MGSDEQLAQALVAMDAAEERAESAERERDAMRRGGGAMDEPSKAALYVARERLNAGRPAHVGWTDTEIQVARLIDEAEQRGHERGVREERRRCASMARQGADECEAYVEENEPPECDDEYTEADAAETAARLDASTHVLRSLADRIESPDDPEGTEGGSGG